MRTTRKKTLLIMLIMSLLCTTFSWPLHSAWAAYSTNADGSNANNFSINEKFTTTSQSDSAYYSWDDNFIYIGYNSADITSWTSNAWTKWVWVYIGGPGGTTSGMNYSGQQPTLPFAAKYHVRFKVDGSYTNRQIWNGSSWTDGGNYTWGTHLFRHDDNQFLKMKLPRADFALDSLGTLQIVSTIVYEDNAGNGDWMWAASPANTFSGGSGFDKDFTTFHEFDLNADTAPLLK
jgi:hypothetical protein